MCLPYPFFQQRALIVYGRRRSNRRGPCVVLLEHCDPRCQLRLRSRSPRATLAVVIDATLSEQQTHAREVTQTAMTLQLTGPTPGCWT